MKKIVFLSILMLLGVVTFSYLISKDIKKQTVKNYKTVSDTKTPDDSIAKENGIKPVVFEGNGFTREADTEHQNMSPKMRKTLDEANALIAEADVALKRGDMLKDKLVERFVDRFKGYPEKQQKEIIESMLDFIEGADKPVKKLPSDLKKAYPELQFAMDNDPDFFDFVSDLLNNLLETQE